VPAEPTSLPPGGALILAAGFGRRFGSDKRTYRLPDGRTLLEATISRYASVYSGLSVVVRPEDAELERMLGALPARPRVVHAPDASLGMGHSLAAGIRAIPDEWQWVSVALGDMPFVTAATLRELLNVFFSAGGQSIVQPEYEGQPGHPVTFPSVYFPQMAALQGDEGARTVLRQADSVIRHPVLDAGVLQDVDRPLD
jgi:molybdenum cofactor cytidylyltransferase